MNSKGFLSIAVRVACSWALSTCTAGHDVTNNTETPRMASPPSETIISTSSIVPSASGRGQVISATAQGIISKTAISNALAIKKSLWWAQHRNVP